MNKVNKLRKIPWHILYIACLVGLLMFTRGVNIGWGLPYPMHPDERNMAASVQSLACSGLNSDCLNPHFFAYGQFPLYLAYFGIQIMRLLTGTAGPVSFIEATLALRFISAIASILTAFVMVKTVSVTINRSVKSSGRYEIPLNPETAVALAVIIFSPYFIQFSHFGTTESLLMLFYSLIAYLSVRILSSGRMAYRDVALLGVMAGLSIATKVSSLIFLAAPLAVIIYERRRRIPALISDVAAFISVAGIAALIASPHNFISWNEFIGSLNYESAVGLGTYKAFYTRQFENTVPLLFQLRRIFPYALGVPMFALGIAGFICLPWKHKAFNALRFMFLVYLIPTSFLYVKWTRFMSPVFPLLTLFGLFLLFHLFRHRRNIMIAVAAILILPGIAFLTVYLLPDARFQASDWIFRNVPENSRIMSESANAVDVPLQVPGSNVKPRNYQYASLFLYDLDTDPNLQTSFEEVLKTADYLIVPSRRIFKNHNPSQYPRLARYYGDLFSGKLGFEEVKVFANPYIGLMDEQAEETWSVFDHPVIRIYRRTGAKPRFEPAGYEETVFGHEGKNYRLFIADTPVKQRQGLMHVRSKEDIGGADGMIFVFKDKSIRTFWNMNTVSDLDLYWLSGDEVVGKTELPSIEKSGTVITVTSPPGVNRVVELLK